MGRANLPSTLREPWYGSNVLIVYAEVAETMRVPLYMMSAGDLGTSPHGVESALSNIMEMSAKWNAVLLLDEADVFLEQRSTHDLERNKLVSSKFFHTRNISITIW